MTTRAALVIVQLIGALSLIPYPAILLANIMSMAAEGPRGPQRLLLIVGFGLHNATEGFGIAAPLAGRVVPQRRLLLLAGLVAGGPTFLGTIIGYAFSSPLLSVLFLATATGALVFVIGELWSVLRRDGINAIVTTALACGFLVAFGTEVLLDLNGG